MQLQSRIDTSGKSPGGGVPGSGLISGFLADVSKLMESQLTAPAGDGSIDRLLGDVALRGGKMIRPGLVLLSGLCCGKLTDEHVRVGAVIEMIHNATLLHDDVIDEGQKRRGRATINSVWGNESAVLVGDFLLSRVFRMCSDMEAEVARSIATAAVRVCEGELRQVTHRRNWQLSEAEYMEIITEKSAALFSVCCRLGGVLADGTEEEVRSLSDFGLNTGIAFQITDDLLDIVGQESSTGKTGGRDADKSKPTLAAIHLLRTVKEGERSEIERRLNSGVRVCGFSSEELVRHGSLDYARRRALGYAEAAIAALGALRESEAKSALIETARFVVRRAG